MVQRKPGYDPLLAADDQTYDHARQRPSTRPASRPRMKGETVPSCSE